MQIISAAEMSINQIFSFALIDSKKFNSIFFFYFGVKETLNILIAIIHS